MRKLKIKTCKFCGNIFETSSGVAVFCGPECKRKGNLVRLRLTSRNLENITKIVKESHIKFPDGSDSYFYIECKFCGYRTNNLSSHIKLHNITCKEYKEKFNVKIISSQSRADNVKGDKNPGYQHKGKLSAFSKNFNKYSGLTDDETGYIINDLVSKQKQTIQDNPQNRSTRIEYWLNRGYSQEESEKLLGERQATFTLEKCICKMGEEVGYERWKKRQDAWQATLDAKSEEEKQKINRKKATKINYKTLYNKDINDKGILYLLKVYNDTENFYKIGITSKSVNERFNSSSSMVKFYNYGIISTHEYLMWECFEKEQSIIKNNKNIKYLPKLHFDGWTECFKSLPIIE